MRIIPVLDLKAGQAVHAVAGDRAHYQPIRTVLHEGSDPIGLARAYRDALGLSDLYLADLDAIAGSPPARPLYAELHRLGLDLWVDAGVRDLSSLPPLLDAGVSTIIVGLETVRGPEALAGLVERLGPALAFSLDLRDGRPLIAEGTEAAWGATHPRALAEAVIALGCRRLLLLDLARVGTGRGTGTLGLLADLRAVHPRLEIAAGGGISGPEDLRRLEDAGASAVLVGSAFHDGRVGWWDCHTFRTE
ncbi:MAG: hisA/hisF family protein [Isosphaeraceae bacterium]|nr:hisA/hisF family protein [Isosphaeraceae bacterium]